MKLWNPFRMPSADEVAIRELEEARRELLQAQTRVEWCTRMMQYQSDRVSRLSLYVSNLGEQRK